MSLVFNRPLRRALSHALNPRTVPLSAELLPRLLESVLLVGGYSPARANTYRYLLDVMLTEAQNPPAYLDGFVDSAVVHALIETAKNMYSSHPYRSLCTLVLRAQAAKRHGQSEVDRQVADGVRALHSDTLWGKKLAGRNIRGWLKRALKEPHQVTEFDRLLRLAENSTGRPALEAYSEALTLHLAQSTDLGKQALLATAARLPSLKTVSSPIAPSTESQSARTLAKNYSALELPLPLMPPKLSMAEIISKLTAEFPWMSSAIAHVELDLLLAESFFDGVPRLRPLLLVGGPGAGKTRFAMRLAELVDQPTAMISAGGAGSARLLVGTPRGWGNARPSLPAEILALNKRGHCVVVTDELDKESSSRDNARFTDGLLAFLEPISASKFFDEALFSNCDFSAISWIAIANDPEPIPAPVLSRYQIVQCQQPGLEHMPQLAEQVLQDLRGEFRLAPSAALLDIQAQKALDRDLRTLTSARDCAQRVRLRVAESLKRRFGSSARSKMLMAPTNSERFH